MSTPTLVTLIPIGYKEIMVLRSCQSDAAQKFLTLIKVSLNKKKEHRLYLHEYCAYEKVSFEIAKNTLIEKRK